MTSSDRPSPEDLERVVASARSEIVRLFEERGVPDEEAERRIGDALVRLAWRWGRVRNRARWLVTTLDKETRNREQTTRERPAGG